MKVLLDEDLARLYSVPTKRLNEQVKRNSQRFPRDFMFRLTEQEVTNLRSQFATSSSGWGGRRYRPQVFTEHGAVMAANILNSTQAIQMSIYVVRAFVALRSVLADNRALARRLEALEKRTAEIDSKHDAFASATRAELAQIIATLRRLMTTPEPPRRPIGFVGP
jgi:hypothetical protein